MAFIRYPDYPLVMLNMIELHKKGVLEEYIHAGFTYVRQVFPEFKKVLRGPTIGCIVELSSRKDVDSVPIESAKGKRLIRRLNYF